jgi:hypothetical protein
VTHLEKVSIFALLPLGRADDLAHDAHAVEDGGVDHDRHGGVVERLGAVGPHVRAVGQIQHLRDDRRAGLVFLQYPIGAHDVEFAKAL